MMIGDGRRVPIGTNRSKVNEIKFIVEAWRYEIEKILWEFRPICLCHGWS
jgi:hypothetical protein